MSKTVKKLVNVPGYGEQWIEVPEETAARVEKDPDWDKSAVKVLDEVDEVLATTDCGRHDVQALKSCVQRLSRLVRRAADTDAPGGIGTSPSGE